MLLNINMSSSATTGRSATRIIIMVEGFIILVNFGCSINC